MVGTTMHKAAYGMHATSSTVCMNRAEWTALVYAPTVRAYWM